LHLLRLVGFFDTVSAQELLKFTDPDHFDRDAIVEAISLLHATAAAFEDSVRDRENRDRVAELSVKLTNMAEEDRVLVQPSRRYAVAPVVGIVHLTFMVACCLVLF